MGTQAEILMPNASSIHPQTRLGPVELTVASLDRQIPFYQDFLGLRLHRRQAGGADLGAGGEDLLRLRKSVV